MNAPTSLHIFCRVVDNYGDIGVCWRLARQFRHEHGLAVGLWVDDLESFRRICPELDPERSKQEVQGVAVRTWRAPFEAPAADEVADIVIEAFACELPQSYVEAMAQRVPKPVWINLEYLSAEVWVEGCHALPSRHPKLPLDKYFFFPGFSEKTGGLPAERDLHARRAAFQGDPGHIRTFYKKLRVAAPDGARVISLFCYPQAPVVDFFDALRRASRPTICLAPDGIAAEAVRGFLRGPARAGARASDGALTVQVLPFMDQDDYDRLLWSCDLNFVRGEDSFMRAQWAARPFVWQIYPQEAGAHWDKFDAFLARYSAGLAKPDAESLEAFWRAWNGAQSARIDWAGFESALPGLLPHAESWAASLARNADLASQLIRFARKIG